MSATDDVLEAADRLIAAFGEARVDDYFACFHPDATFVFYTADCRLESRAQWRTEFDRLAEEDRFRIVACTSTARRVQVIGDVGIFTHDVETSVTSSAGPETLHERETIVFAKQTDSIWLAIHEHLSPLPR